MFQHPVILAVSSTITISNIPIDLNELSVVVNVACFILYTLALLIIIFKD
jgi:hypothetical protein